MSVFESFRYGYKRRLEGATFDQAVKKVTAALKEEGFGVLTQIDVKDTLKNKLGVEFRQYVILGACNPSLAREALTADPQIGLLLPCNVVLQEDSQGNVIVSIADPKVMFTIFDNASLIHIAEEADTRLRRVMDSLGEPSV